MQEFKDYFSHWEKEEKIIIARVISTWGSSPRPIGSALIIDSQLNMYGSVSGGCVEGAVLKEAQKLFVSGGAKILKYGVSNDEAWSVGLSCGGAISIFIQELKMSDLRHQIFNLISTNQSFIWLTKLNNSVEVDQMVIDAEGNSYHNEANKELVEKSITALNERNSKILEVQNESYFAHIFPRKSQMLIIGAAHISADLIHLAKFYNFETIVIDPRATFTDKTNFYDAPDQLLMAYPSEVLGDFILDQHTYVIILSHDPKIDDNALHILLTKNIAYLGALGSKKTHASRVKRLVEAGFSQDDIAKISAPIGLDINAKSPREIALSIMSEVIQVKNQF